MKSRQLKFRHYFPSTKVMTAGMDPMTFITCATGKEDFWEGAVWMESTGHVDSANKEIFECDILRETLEMEHGDVNHYFIVTWISEWSMFAALMHEEYDKYITNGAEELDESMFWTFTIEKGNSYTVCGNILEHPDYIRKALESENLGEE